MRLGGMALSVRVGAAGPCWWACGLGLSGGSGDLVGGRGWAGCCPAGLHARWLGGVGVNWDNERVVMQSGGLRG